MVPSWMRMNYYSPSYCNIWTCLPQQSFLPHVHASVCGTVYPLQVLTYMVIFSLIFQSYSHYWHLEPHVWCFHSHTFPTFMLATRLICGGYCAVNFFLLLHPFPICSKTTQWWNTRYFTEFTCSPNFLSVLYIYFPYVFRFHCYSFIWLPVDNIWYTPFLQHVPFLLLFPLF